MRSVAAVVALVVCVHAGVWALLQRQQPVPDFDGPLASISYSPYARSQHPDLGDRPTAAQIRTDLELSTPYSRAIRTYSATGGLEQGPAVAAELGLKVAVGIWLDDRVERDGQEIQAALDLARRYTNVSAIVVGNETIKTRALAEVAEIRVETRDRVDTIKLSDLAFDEDALRADNRRADERGKLQTIAEVVAACAHPRWRCDVLARKLVFARRHGLVHGVNYELDAQGFGL
jgi:exo-beta-1,3-glucanase (GH17 family)